MFRQNRISSSCFHQMWMGAAAVCAIVAEGFLAEDPDGRGDMDAGAEESSHEADG
jgi:hypothetical protein